MKTPVFEVGTVQLRIKNFSLYDISVPLHSIGINLRKYCVGYIVSKLSDNEVGCEKTIFCVISTPATSFFRNSTPHFIKTIKTKTMYATVLEEGKRILINLIDAHLIRNISPLPLLDTVKLSIKDKKCWLSYVFD